VNEYTGFNLCRALTIPDVICTILFRAIGTARVKITKITLKPMIISGEFIGLTDDTVMASETIFLAV